MRSIPVGLCGALACAVVAGCWRVVPSGSPPPPPPTTVAEPAEPEASIPAETAGEPNTDLVAAGRRLLGDSNYTPLPTYSERGKLGIIRLVEDLSVKLDDAIVVLEDKEITDSRMKLENGYVFFNVDKTGPLKVGDFELTTGECVLFEDGEFQKLDLVIAVE